MEWIGYLAHADDAAGTVLSRRGDATDAACDTASGEVEIPEGRDPVLAFVLVRLITDRMEDNSRRAAQATAAPRSMSAGPPPG